MSVIVRHLESGKITLLTKGADSVIEKLLKPGQSESLATVMSYVHDYAVEGLRTLLLTKRELTEQEY